MLDSGMGRRRRFIGLFLGFLVLVVPASLVLRQTGEADRIRADFRALGLPLDAAGLDAWYPHVPETSNAAPAVLEAAALLKGEPRLKVLFLERGTNGPPRGTPWPVEQREALADVVRENAEGLRLLRAALARPASRYPVDFFRGRFDLPPHYTALPRAASHLRAAAILAVVDGDGEEAVQRLVEVLKLTGTLALEPTDLAQVNRLIALEGAVSTAEDVLSLSKGGSLDGNRLTRLSAALEAAMPQDSPVRAAVGEMCLVQDIFQMPRSEFAGRSQGPELAQFLAYGWLGFRSLDEGYYLAVTREIVEACAQAGTDRLTRLDRLAADVDKRTRSWWGQRARLVSGMGLGDRIRRAKWSTRVEVRLTAARVACALESFRLAHAGSLPERLDQLVPQWLPAVPSDPFDGQPLRYRRHESGYTVYSVGDDRKDSGGREGIPGRGFNPPESTDLTFTVERPGP